MSFDFKHAFQGYDLPARKTSLFSIACGRLVSGEKTVCDDIISLAEDLATNPNTTINKEILVELANKSWEHGNSLLNASTDYIYRNGPYASYFITAYVVYAVIYDYAGFNCTAIADYLDFYFDESKTKIAEAIFKDIFPQTPKLKLPEHELKPTIQSLALQAYNTKDFTILPILADAMEESGVTDNNLLLHLRSNQQHWRGCWALDSVLGH